VAGWFEHLLWRAERGDGVQLDDVGRLEVLQVVVRLHVRVQLGRRQGGQEARVPAGEHRAAASAGGRERECACTTF
jgi:hypothetical protein